MSFSVHWSWPDLFPSGYDLRAWEYVFLSNTSIWNAVWMTVVIAFVVTFINILLSIPAANAIARFKWKGKAWIELLFYAPLIVPPLITSMGIYLDFLRYGLIGTVTGVILAHIAPTLPYMIRALVISFQTLSFDWENQAATLGANGWQRLRYVVIPHLVPGLIVGCSLSMLVSFSQYIVTLLIGSGKVQTIPVLMFPYISGGDQAIGSVFIMVYTIMTLLSLFFMQFILTFYYRRKGIPL